MTFTPIGVVRSPFRESKGTPIQPLFSSEKTSGTIEIFPEYQDGLQDLHEFSHLFVFYHFHKITSVKMIVTPFLDNQSHGIFATRSPSRPNRIGFSLLPLLGVEGNILHVSHLDILDGTPIFDIKPYIPSFDSPQGDISAGWYEKIDPTKGTTQDDGRFI